MTLTTPHPLAGTALKLRVRHIETIRIGDHIWLAPLLAISLPGECAPVTQIVTDGSFVRLTTRVGSITKELGTYVQTAENTEGNGPGFLSVHHSKN